MNGIRIPNTPIAVDFWKIRQCVGVHLFFLSHAHSDHTCGLSSSWAHPLYTSSLTKKIILHKLKVRDELVHELELNRVHVIPLDDVGRETMNVIMIDANHCPGAVMFLFEGYFGRILYTGDFRYTPAMFSHSVLRRQPSLDVLYLDDTYIDMSNSFLKREEYVKQIIGIIDRHPAHHVYIGMRTLGKEELLVQLATHFSTVVSVSEDMFQLISLLDLPSVFTREQNRGFIHALSMNALSMKKVRVKILREKQGQAIFIEPSALNTLKTKNWGELWRVPYSDHSSYVELHKFVSHLKPRCVRPIVHTTASMSVFDYCLDNSPPTVFVVPPSVSAMIHHDARGTASLTALRHMRRERRRRMETTRSNSRRSKTARGVVYRLPETPPDDNRQVDTHQPNPAATECESETGACASTSAEVDVGVPYSLQVPEPCESAMNLTYMSQVADLSTMQAASSQYLAYNHPINNLSFPSNQLWTLYAHSLSNSSGQYIVNSTCQQFSQSLFSSQGQPTAGYLVSSLGVVNGSDHAGNTLISSNLTCDGSLAGNDGECTTSMPLNMASIGGYTDEPDLAVTAENVDSQVQLPESGGCTSETDSTESDDTGLRITNVISLQALSETSPSECTQHAAPSQPPAVQVPIGSIDFLDDPHPASMPDLPSQQYCQVAPDPLSAIIICPSPSDSVTAGNISQIRTDNGGIKNPEEVEKTGENSPSSEFNAASPLQDTDDLSQSESKESQGRKKLVLKLGDLLKRAKANPLVESVDQQRQVSLRIHVRKMKSSPAMNQLSHQPCEGTDAMAPNIKPPSSVPNTSSEVDIRVSKSAQALQHSGPEELVSSPLHHASNESNSAQSRSSPSNVSTIISEQNFSRDHNSNLVDVPALFRHDVDAAAPSSRAQSQNNQTRAHLASDEASPCHHQNFSPASKQYSKHAGSKPPACGSVTDNEVCYQTTPSTNNVDAAPTDTQTGCEKDAVLSTISPIQTIQHINSDNTESLEVTQDSRSIRNGSQMATITLRSKSGTNRAKGAGDEEIEKSLFTDTGHKGSRVNSSKSQSPVGKPVADSYYNHLQNKNGLMESGCSYSKPEESCSVTVCTDVAPATASSPISNIPLETQQLNKMRKHTSTHEQSSTEKRITSPDQKHNHSDSVSAKRKRRILKPGKIVAHSTSALDKSVDNKVIENVDVEPPSKQALTCSGDDNGESYDQSMQANQISDPTITTTNSTYDAIDNDEGKVEFCENVQHQTECVVSVANVDTSASLSASYPVRSSPPPTCTAGLSNQMHELTSSHESNQRVAPEVISKPVPQDKLFDFDLSELPAHLFTQEAYRSADIDISRVGTSRVRVYMDWNERMKPAWHRTFSRQVRS